MAFKPGDPKPEGSGMKSGQVTAKNILAREFLSGERCPLKNAVRILEESAELNDKERLDGWIKLVEYVASKLKSTEIKMDDDSKKALTLAYANPKQP
jgi:hypothetical protein